MLTRLVLMKYNNNYKAGSTVMVILKHVITTLRDEILKPHLICLSST